MAAASHEVIFLSPRRWPAGIVTLQESDGGARAAVCGQDLHVQGQSGQAVSHLHQGWSRKSHTKRKKKAS